MLCFPGQNLSMCILGINVRECGIILFIKSHITLYFSADLIVQYSLCVLCELAEQEAAAVDMAGTLGSYFLPWAASCHPPGPSCSP